MLANGYLSVWEIGENLGYASPEYFSSAFKKATGVPPAAYRAEKSTGCE
ncbi:MAG: AraC family transcriptional regulator [Clostridia bacterium]|nr:AraC family transcriptional regulator [Clostridia bacterium]